MIDINVLLYMALSAILTGWIYDHWLLRKEIAEAVNAANEVTRIARLTNEKIHTAHNEQAQVIIDLGKKVMEIGNKVELHAMHSNNKKMFNETKK